MSTKSGTVASDSSTRNATANSDSAPAGKTREQIMAEREAKKLAKQAKKVKVVGAASNATPTAEDSLTTLVNNVNASVVSASAGKSTSENHITAPAATALKSINTIAPSTVPATGAAEKSREAIKAEREAKKLAKQTAKAAKVGDAEAALSKLKIHDAAEPATLIVSDEKKKPALTKAERRAIQEAQRAAKAQTHAQKTEPPKKEIIEKAPRTSAATAKVADKTISTVEKKIDTACKSQGTKYCNIKLFNHLVKRESEVSRFINNPDIHPSIVRLGEQYAKRTVVGSNARCIAFLNVLKTVINDFETPPNKEFGRSLEVKIQTYVDHLEKCRPLAVSVSNAHKHIKHVLTQLPTDKPESELKEQMTNFIDTYIENQIGKAAQAISSSMQAKITDGDVLLTFGCSSLIDYICEEAQKRKVDFRVIIVDSRPFCEGQELLRRLSIREIPCTYVLINAIGFVMPEATKVLLGAHALLSNGYVMARTGTAQVALVARSYNVPVLVCCETHKFSERFQTDAIVYNELGNPDDLVLSDKCCLTNWHTQGKMTPLNLIYDITPPELVTAVVTEVAILPCTSVPVILRIKPTEIGYFN